MARHLQETADWDDEDAEGDGWDGGSEEDEATIPCPYCHRDIYENSIRCPYCEQYLSDEDVPPGRKPWWIIVGILLCLAVLLSWFVMGN
jgi:hypothetical protein